MVDASKEFDEMDEKLLEKLKSIESPLVLVLNKIDLLNKSELIEKTLFWNKKFDFKEVIPISALKEDNIEELKNIIYSYLPEGPMYYSSDAICSYPERFLVSELIREKILFYTQEEVPHSVAVVCDAMKKKGDKYLINATIVVDKDSKKGIIIGKQGSMLKKIGTSARKAIEEFLGYRVNLELFVRVEKDWKNSNRYLKEFGYKNEE
jgi:GTP-binding protein Era